MRPLRYAINVTLDGCCHHEGVQPTDELHRHATAWLNRSDTLLFGRVIYEMMESAFRLPPGATSVPGLTEWMQPFARTIHAARKYVVSSTLSKVDWNAELVRGDLGEAVKQLKQESDNGVFLGGVTLLG